MEKTESKRGIYRLLIALIKSAVTADPVDERVKQVADSETLPLLFKVADSHDLAHLISFALEKNGIPVEDGKLKAEYRRRQMLAVYRTEIISYEYDRMCQALSEAGIDFIPLKGSIIRKYYPSPWMRTSCDIDVLVKEADLDAAAAVLTEKLICKSDGRDTHDMSLFTESDVHIELHWLLVEYFDKADPVLCTVWDSALETETPHMKKMSDGMFYFYHIVHMAKHVIHGGCGVRPFIDLYLMDAMPQFAPEKTDQFLKEGGMLAFAQGARRLSQVWFGGEEPDDLTDRLANYILSAGVYGSEENRTSIDQGRAGGKLGFVLKRLFISSDMLRRKYPTMKHGWQYPFFWLRWIFEKIAKGRIKHGVSMISAADSMSDQCRDANVTLMDDLGL